MVIGYNNPWKKDSGYRNPYKRDGEGSVPRNPRKPLSREKLDNLLVTCDNPHSPIEGRMKSWRETAGLTPEMEEKWDSIFRVALFGKQNGKTNMIVDLDVLIAVGEALLRTTNEVVMHNTLAQAVAFGNEPPK